MKFNGNGKKDSVTKILVEAMKDRIVALKISTLIKDHGDGAQAVKGKLERCNQLYDIVNALP